jgi:hypothetical protein
MTRSPVDNQAAIVSAQAEAAGALVPDELLDDPLLEESDDDDLAGFAAVVDESPDESPDFAAAALAGVDSVFVDRSESENFLPAAWRLSLR